MPLTFGLSTQPVSNLGPAHASFHSLNKLIQYLPWVRHFPRCWKYISEEQNSFWGLDLVAVDNFPTKNKYIVKSESILQCHIGMGLQKVKQGNNSGQGKTFDLNEINDLGEFSM